MLPLRGDNIRVTVEQYRWGLSTPGQARNQIRPVRRKRQEFDLKPCAGKKLSDVLDCRPLIAGWIGRVEADQGLENFGRSGDGWHFGFVILAWGRDEVF